MTQVDLGILLEDAVDALVRIAGAAEKEVGVEIARLQEEIDHLRDQLRAVKEE